MFFQILPYSTNKFWNIRPSYDWISEICLALQENPDKPIICRIKYLRHLTTNIFPLKGKYMQTNIKYILLIRRQNTLFCLVLIFYGFKVIPHLFTMGILNKKYECLTVGKYCYKFIIFYLYQLVLYVLVLYILIIIIVW